VVLQEFLLEEAVVVPLAEMVEEVLVSLVLEAALAVLADIQVMAEQVPQGVIQMDWQVLAAVLEVVLVVAAVAALEQKAAA
jgi:hypothetical protein